MRRRALPWVIVGALAAALVVSVLIQVRIGFLYGAAFGTGEAVVLIAFVLVGALVASRRPGNRIGWVLLLMPAGVTLERLAGALVLARLGAGGEPPPALLWMAGTAWPSVISIVMITAVIPQLFPTGRPLSPRWRWALLGIVAFSGIVAVSFAFEPIRFDAPFAGLSNPFDLSLIDTRPFGFLELTFLPLVLLVSVASLVIRYRRSDADGKRQIRWFVYAIGVLFVFFAVSALFPDQGEDTAQLAGILFLTVLTLMPVSIGIAVLKYRLYDIDVVINKTVVYGGLAGFITAVYVGVVVGIGSLVGRGDEPNLALSIAATAVVAVAFQPVRARVQHLANRLVYGRRATPYEVMAGFAHRMSASLEVEEVLPRMAEAAARGVGASRARIRVHLPHGGIEEITWPDEHSSGSFDRTITITHRGETVGEVSVAKLRGESLSPAEGKLLEDLASQAGLALHNARLTIELRSRLEQVARQASEIRASRRRILSAADDERRRLERAVAAGAERRLKVMAGRLREATARLGPDPEGAQRLLEAVGTEAQEALEELRDLARGIYPPLLADAGLVAALEAQARRARIPMEMEADGIGRYPQEAEATVYFCCVEALTNVTRHAGATNVEVRLAEEDGELSFSVSDDGAGFDPKSTPRGPGLTTMADRLDALSGELDLRSKPGAGTTLSGRLPVHARETVG